MSKKMQPNRKNKKSGLPKWVIWASASLIALLAVLAYFVVRSSHQMNLTPTPTPTIALPAEISVEDAYTLFQNNAAVFLDVRPANGWVAYHIGSSVSIPFDELSSRESELPPHRVIVIVDQAGELGSQARAILKGAGFSLVTVMTGGMDAWVQHHYPFIGTAPY